MPDFIKNSTNSSLPETGRSTKKVPPHVFGHPQSSDIPPQQMEKAMLEEDKETTPLIDEKDVHGIIKEKSREESTQKTTGKLPLKTRIMKIIDPRQDDVKFTRGLWQALSEYICTFIFVFYACGSVVGAQYLFPPANGSLMSGSIIIACGQGFSLAISILCASSISGGHLNPAVTLSALLVGRISLIRAILFIIGQFGGAITAAAILKAIIPDQYQYQLGATGVNPVMSLTGAFFLEFFMTFTLVFVIYATSIDPLGLGKLAPLSIGLVVLIDVLIGVQWTGASMNPARSLGPMLVQNSWDHYAIFFCAPLSGAVFAALLYELYLLRRVYVPPTQAVIDEAKKLKKQQKKERHAKKRAEAERRHRRQLKEARDEGFRDSYQQYVNMPHDHSNSTMIPQPFTTDNTIQPQYPLSL